MGCDGGTIPRRDELVRTKKKPEKVERDIENAAKWKYCALNQSALREPIVACYLGRLYNKEAVIEALLAKKISENENTSHIRNLKDIKTLNLTKNPSFDVTKVDKGDEFKDYNVARFICPVVGIEMNGKHKFCAIWSCGCVVSERALKEVKSEVCHKCGKTYNEEDVIVLNGTDEEMDQYQSRRDKKQGSKTKKQQPGTPDDSKPSTSGVQTTRLALEKQNSSVAGTSTIPKNAIGPKAIAHKRKDGESNGATNAKKPKTIQDDPNATKVYKSLFTTCEAAKKQPKAHWVTHDPMFY